MVLFPSDISEETPTFLFVTVGTMSLGYTKTQKWPLKRKKKLVLQSLFLKKY